MNPFNKHAGESNEEVEFTRASGDVVCPQCGKVYYKHPYSEHRDFQGEPFLNRLCDGRLVKL